MKTVKSILIFSVTFLSVVIFFEIFLSSAGILSPVIRIDPEKGERYLPHKMCSSSFVSEEFGLAETNSSGWFGKDFKDEGPDDISIAVLIDLWPPLLAMQKNGDDPYYWPIPDKHGHWNIKAHELIGKVIAGYMSQIIQKKS